MRVAYTLEQCWHRVPGGTGTAALEMATALVARDDVDLVGVAGRHRRPPTEGFEPGIPVRVLPFGGPLLYESWLRFGWPVVESVVDTPDLVHATTVIPPATKKPLVVTLHDIAFVRHPEFFTDRGNRVFNRSMRILQEKAALVLCSSSATIDDCVANGFDVSRLRHVPLGVNPIEATTVDTDRVRSAYSLPDEFVLFVGTMEPRKNLKRLIAAMARTGLPLVIVGMKGWGDEPAPTDHDVRFTGFVPRRDLAGLYSACTVFAYPSILEGFGMPVLEAMSAGAAVVTSRGTSTAEVAGGAAVLVDPLDIDSISSGIIDARMRREELVAAGRIRARQMTWAATAERVASAYNEVAR